MERIASHLVASSSSAADMGSSIQDLSYISSPIGGFLEFEDTNLTSNWREWMLSDKQVDEYLDNGYIRGVKVLSKRQCEEMRAEFVQFMDANHPKAGLEELMHEFHANQSSDPHNVLCHGLGHWRISPLFHDLIFHPAITIPTAQLLAADRGVRKGMLPVRLWHDQMFCKPPHQGGCVAWHQGMHLMVSCVFLSCLVFLVLSCLPCLVMKLQMVFKFYMCTIS